MSNPDPFTNEKGGRPATALRRAAFAGAAIAVAAASPASAQSDSAALDSSAQVAASCSVSVDGGGMIFGAVDVNSGLPDDATATLRVVCNPVVSVTAMADAGTGAGATFAVRKMANGISLLNYSLYTTSARTTVWGDGQGGTGVLSGITSAQGLLLRITYGRVFTGQAAVSSGTYTDTVTVTVSY